VIKAAQGFVAEVEMSRVPDRQREDGMKTRTLVPVALIAGCLALIAPTRAHAYIDPGTGSFIIQALIAGFLGALFYFNFYSRKAKRFLIDCWTKLWRPRAAARQADAARDEERAD
jgi:hypothetical protein